jgi:hypothetical protein
MASKDLTFDHELIDDDDGRPLQEIERQVLRAIREVNFGSVEVIIHGSRVVQIERKEKIRV